MPQQLHSWALAVSQWTDGRMKMPKRFNLFSERKIGVSNYDVEQISSEGNVGNVVKIQRNDGKNGKCSPNPTNFPEFSQDFKNFDKKIILAFVNFHKIETNFQIRTKYLLIPIGKLSYP